MAALRRQQQQTNGNGLVGDAEEEKVWSTIVLRTIQVEDEKEEEVCKQAGPLGCWSAPPLPPFPPVNVQLACLLHLCSNHNFVLPLFSC